MEIRLTKKTYKMWKSLEEFQNRELYMDAYDYMLIYFVKNI